MELAEALAIGAAGVGAGAINAVVGSGTLITFPVLIALGYSPLTANVSNNVGLVPGALAGTWGYRRELRGQRHRVLGLGAFSLSGGLAGAALLLLLPASVFDAVVPVLIALALTLVVLQPRLAERRTEPAPGVERRPPLRLGIFGIGVYGGYFGAAQGILLLGALGIAIPDSLQRLNALKNLLAFLVNVVAGLVFIVAADVDWAVAGLIALGSIVGGYLGAHYGRRLSEPVLRGVVVAVGLTAIVRLTVG
jgi:uncharacterized membrane protein YfcA